MTCGVRSSERLDEQEKRVEREISAEMNQANLWPEFPFL